MGQTDTDYLTSAQAITRDKFLKKLENNVIQESATLMLTKKNSSVIITDSGGENIQVPVMVGKNDTVQSYSQWDDINTDPSAGFIDATIRKAHYSAVIAINRAEEKYNQGDSRIVSILASRMMQAELSIKDAVNADMYLDGTGNASKDLVGFLAMIPTSASAGTYMGINGAVETAWTHKYKTVTTASALYGLSNLFWQLSDGSDSPDIITTDALGMDNLETLQIASGLQNLYVKTALSEYGFKTLSYKGIPVTLDKGCPQVSTTVPIYHMLNSKYLGFYNEYEMGDWQEPTRQAGRIAKVFMDCQLFTSRRERQGKLVCS